jgi:hypothetical protein
MFPGLTYWASTWDSGNRREKATKPGICGGKHPTRLLLEGIGFGELAGGASIGMIWAQRSL